MICPYCDSVIRNLPDNRTCPQCGARLEESVEEPFDLEDYYYQYKPNRLKAIKALRRDTGMGLVEAKNTITRIFDELSGESHEDPAVAWQILKDSFK